MSKVAVALLVTLVACLAFTPRADAGANVTAKIQFHLLQAGLAKTACTRPEATPACWNVVTTGSVYPPAYYAYVLVTDGYAPAGIAGLQFGISYDDALNSGVDIFSWTLCATHEFPQPAPAWPHSLSGNLITWDYTNACQRYEPGGPGSGVVANAGYFYMAAYGPDRFAIIPRPVDGFAKVADCSASEDIIEGDGIYHRVPSHLGVAGFGKPGCSPCGFEGGCDACLISGDSTVGAETSHTYTVPSSYPWSNVKWQISGGNATITSQSENTVTVSAGVQGYFFLDFDGTAGWGRHCTKRVVVESAVPVEPSTWSRIKTLNR